MQQIFKEIASAVRMTIGMVTHNFRQTIDILLVGSVISLIIFLAADVICGRSVKSVAVIVDKVYIPERNYMTISTYRDSKGRFHSHPVFHHDPAEWKFIVKDNAAEVVNIWCSQANYYRTPVGTQIPIVSKHGLWTGWRYFTTTPDY